MNKDRNNTTENKRDEELILGRNPVIEALKADKLIDMIFVNPEAKGSISLILKLAKERDIPVKQVREVKLDYMAGGAAHQGVIAVGACAEYVEVEDILAAAVLCVQPFQCGGHHSGAGGDDRFLHHLVGGEFSGPHK